MKIVFYTNCQGDKLYELYLCKIDLFRSSQVICIKNYYDITSDDILHIMEADMLIYQPVSVKHGIRTTENASGVLNYLKPNCIKICFPSIFLDMWCFSENNGLYIGGHTLYKYSHLNLQQVLELYDSGKYDFELKPRLDYSIQYMQKKERDFCNIHVTDFIIANYKKHKLMYTQNHPTDILYRFLAKEICRFLNISSVNIDDIPVNNQIETFGWKFSHYMKTELELEYDEPDESAHYRDHIIMLSIHPEYIKKM
jgi:hypothetical protein